MLTAEGGLKAAEELYRNVMSPQLLGPVEASACQWLSAGNAAQSSAAA